MEEGATTQIHRSLKSAENLSLPRVQVVVLSANMSCSHCRQRVSMVVSKFNTGLLDYMVDMRKKEVTVRGVVEAKKKKARRGRSSTTHTINKDKLSENTLGFFRLQCFGT